MRMRRVESANFMPRLAAIIRVTYELMLVTGGVTVGGGDCGTVPPPTSRRGAVGLLAGVTTSSSFLYLRTLTFLFPFEPVGPVCTFSFVTVAKFRGRRPLSLTASHLKNSSTTAAARQLVTKSAANRVILFGR